MKPHPYADIFPMMTEAEMDGLTESIRENGLLYPIITHEGQILDGRNRQRACERAGVAPAYKEYDGNDPLGSVMAHNLERRHLNESQRALVAAKWAALKHGGDRRSEEIKSSKDGLKSTFMKTRAEAAEMLNVGVASIDRAKRVMRDAPEMIEKIERGEITVTAAHREVFCAAATPSAQQPPVGTTERHRGSYADWQRFRDLCGTVEDAAAEMDGLKVDQQHKIQSRIKCEAMAVRFSKLAQKLGS
jgi:ParB-like chromosome segregation protein Spo0J